MHGADLTAIAHVGALQDLGDGMRSAPRKLRLRIAGDQLQNFHAACFIIGGHTARNRHLRQHEGLYALAFKKLVGNLLGRQLAQTLELLPRGVAFELPSKLGVRLWKAIIVGNQSVANDRIEFVVGLTP